MSRGKWSLATTCTTTTCWRFSWYFLLPTTCLSNLHTSKWNWNWMMTSECLIDLELHYDSFLFFAPCNTITFHNVKVCGFFLVFFISIPSYSYCCWLCFQCKVMNFVCVLINVFHGCCCYGVSCQFQTPETLTSLLLFQLGTELWPWRTWTADGYIRKVASQKTVKFF